MSVFLVFSLWRQTCPCSRESSSTVPGWPSRLQLSIWPSTSSFSWTPTPARPSTPPRSCWRWTSMARGGPLTGSSSSLKTRKTCADFRGSRTLADSQTASVIYELFQGISECQVTGVVYKSSMREAEVCTAPMPGQLCQLSVREGGRGDINTG